MEDFDITCPLCGGEVGFSDEIDSHYESPEEYVAYNYGTCDACRAEIQWKEIYRLQAIVNVKVKE